MVIEALDKGAFDSFYFTSIQLTKCNLGGENVRVFTSVVSCIVETTLPGDIKSFHHGPSVPNSSFQTLRSIIHLGMSASLQETRQIKLIDEQKFPPIA